MWILSRKPCNSLVKYLLNYSYFIDEKTGSGVKNIAQVQAANKWWNLNPGISIPKPNLLKSLVILETWLSLGFSFSSFPLSNQLQNSDHSTSASLFHLFVPPACCMLCTHTKCNGLSGRRSRVYLKPGLRWDCYFFFLGLETYDRALCFTLVKKERKDK